MQSLGIAGLSKSEVSRLCAVLDDQASTAALYHRASQAVAVLVLPAASVLAMKRSYVAAKIRARMLMSTSSWGSLPDGRRAGSPGR